MPEPEDLLSDKLHSIAQALDAVPEWPAFRNIAIQKAREAILEALKICQREAVGVSPTPDDIARAELEYKLEPGFFDATIVEHHGSLSVEMALIELQAELDEESAGEVVVEWVARICTAALIAGVVGAPLEAYVLHNDVLTDMHKGGLLGAVGDETTDEDFDEPEDSLDRYNDVGVLRELEISDDHPVALPDKPKSDD